MPALFAYFEEVEIISYYNLSLLISFGVLCANISDLEFKTPSPLQGASHNTMSNCFFHSGLNFVASFKITSISCSPIRDLYELISSNLWGCISQEIKDIFAN